MTQAEYQASMLVANSGKQIDLGRELSFPNAKNFVEERVESMSVQHSYRNELATAKKIVFGSLNNSQFATIVDLLSAVGGDLLVDDGVIFDDNGKEIVIESQDAMLKVGEMIRMGSNSPFRITSSLIDCRKLDGSENVAALTTTVESVFVSPFKVADRKKLQLARFLDGGKFNNGIVNIDWSANGLPFHISPENFVVMTLPAESVLNVTHQIGAIDSAAQRFFRKTKQADAVIRPLLGDTSR